ncbi:hypothetical protein H4R21_001565 [Coemansia helicoidea]|uniref:Uncharacterized protein n=1 Tax=Coemansia helicoidea TaxID=1286919 RepID=A0ACC1LC74_9FUNG|nr:hypothetical protein H4R21_001565 [Coemansia helicoidea]
MGKAASGKISKKKGQPLAKPARSSKKATEIDDIFAAPVPAATRPAPAEAKPAKPVKVVDASAAGKPKDQPKQKQNPPADNDGFADSRGKQSKYTDDGMRVFYMEDLRIGEGNGDTPDCPFDCQCCF